ncbi:hypothetical protein C2G38_2031090 [Gigaspora rosea]|uniref:Uncharacterized protein n=1 Tax=Gigaspora rosea TaxID=44941 RepID=A0A397VS74_9GLOM|nr:hypothetical protein C2G38_2031090 [Gigaspora rosea]
MNLMRRYEDSAKRKVKKIKIKGINKALICYKNACDTDMDEKYMDEANSEYVEREKAIAEPKLEKEDRLVLDPGKIINENAAVGLGEIVEKNDIEGDELNIEEVFDYCDKSAGMDYEDEIIQVDKKRKSNIPGVGCVNYDDFEANGNNEAREVDRMAKTSIQKKSKKELDFEARYQGDDRGGCVKKELNNRGLIDFDIETRKTAFDEYDIPVVSDDNNMISSNQGKDDEGMSSMIESDPKVARHDKEAMMEKMSGEKYKGSGKTNELLKRVLKVLMKDDTLNNVNDKIRKAEINQHNIPEVIDEIERNDDNRLNDTFETREAEISKNDIPDHGVENVDNRDKAPDSRAKINDIRMKNIIETHNDIKEKYLHEYGFLMKNLAMMNFVQTFDRGRVLLDNLLKIMELWGLFLQIMMERRSCLCWKLRGRSSWGSSSCHDDLQYAVNLHRMKGKANNRSEVIAYGARDRSGADQGEIA